MKKALWSLLLIAGWLHAETLRVTGGAVDNQVFQRGADNRATLVLIGSSSAPEGKPIEARVTRQFLDLGGFAWQPAGRIHAGRFTATVSHVPVGGPYSIELRVPGTDAVAAVKDVMVGDLWVLAGQSNMEGVGNLTDVEPPNSLVHSFDQSDHWLIAEEPLHSLPDSVDPVHWRKNAQGQPERLTGEAQQKFRATRAKGAGLGLPFAVEMVRRTGVPIGLLPCAHGGTSMNQWDPALRDKGGDSLYGSMVRRVTAAGGVVTGLLWYQGESDANPKDASDFSAKFENLIARVRTDFHQPDLPFYYVQIGRFTNDQNLKEWNLVQENQRLLAAKIPHTGMVASVDFELDDGIHVNTQEHKRLGRRLANLATGKANTPEPVSAKLQNGIIRVAFSSVSGGLHSQGRIAGFEVHSPAGAYLPIIYKARVDPADPSAVLLFIGGKVPDGAMLHYGFGKDPYCNLHDAEDMAVPVFGPMPIEIVQ